MQISVSEIWSNFNFNLLFFFFLIFSQFEEKSWNEI